MFAIVPDSNDYKKNHLWLHTLYIKNNPEKTYHPKNESCFFKIFFFVEKLFRFLKEDRSLFLWLFCLETLTVPKITLLSIKKEKNCFFPQKIKFVPEPFVNYPK